MCTHRHSRTQHTHTLGTHIHSLKLSHKHSHTHFTSLKRTHTHTKKHAHHVTYTHRKRRIYNTTQTQSLTLRQTHVAPHIANANALCSTLLDYALEFLCTFYKLHTLARINLCITISSQHLLRYLNTSVH